MADILLQRPEAGQVVTQAPQPEDRLVFEFEPGDALLERVEDNLVLSFEDGSSIQLTDFYVAYTSENMPTFVIGDAEVPGEAFFAALSEDLMPAAGAGTGTALGSGLSVDFINGELFAGIDRLARLDQEFAETLPPPPTDTDPDLNLAPSLLGFFVVDDGNNDNPNLEGFDFTMTEEGVGRNEIGGAVNAVNPNKEYSGDHSVTIQLVGSDPDGDPLTYSITGSFPYGSISIDESTGRVTFTLDESLVKGLNQGEIIPIIFQVTVSDGQGGTSSGTVTLGIIGTNDGPMLDFSDTDGTFYLGGVEETNKLSEVDGDTVYLKEDVDAFKEGIGDFINSNPLSDVLGGDNFEAVVEKLLALQSDLSQDALRDLIESYSSADFAASLSESILKEFEELVESLSAAASTGLNAGLKEDVATTVTFTVSSTDDDRDTSVGNKGDEPSYYVSNKDAFNKFDDGDQDGLNEGAEDDIHLDIADNGVATDDQVGTEVFGTYGKLTMDEVTGDGSYTVYGDPGNTIIDSDPKSPTYGQFIYDGVDGDAEALARYNKVQALAEGEPYTETFYIYVKDEVGAWVAKPFEVTVTGTNDAPIIHEDASDLVIKVREEGVGKKADPNAFDDGKDVAKGHIVASDVDNGAVLTYSVEGANNDGWSAPTDPGVNNFDLAITNDYGTLYLNSATGKYKFVIDNDSDVVNQLDEGDKVKLNLTFTVTDDHNATDSVDVKLVIKGTNDQPIIDEDASTLVVKVREEGVGIGANPNAYDDGKNTVEGSIAASDVDSDAVLTYSVEGDNNDGWSVPTTTGMQDFDQAITNEYGTLYLNSATGEYKFVIDNNSDAVNQLDEGDKVKLNLTFTVSDEHNATDSVDVKLVVKGTNERPELNLSKINTLAGEGDLIAVEDDDKTGLNHKGQATATDDDADDVGNKEDVANANLKFFVSTEAAHDHFSQDSTTANDDLALVEKDATNTDADKTVSNTVTGDFGTFTIKTDGSYIYELDDSKVQHLGKDDTEYETFYVYVKDSNGAWVAKPVKVEIKGTNDPIIIDSVSETQVSEVYLPDGTQNSPADDNFPNQAIDTSGVIKFTDVDGDAVSFSWNLESQSDQPELWTSEGVKIFWKLSADGMTLTGYAGEHGTEVIILKATDTSATDGQFEYSVELKQSVSHDDPDQKGSDFNTDFGTDGTTDADNLSKLEFGFTLNDGTADTTSSVNVQIQDDVVDVSSKLTGSDVDLIEKDVLIDFEDGSINDLGSSSTWTDAGGNITITAGRVYGEGPDGSTYSKEFSTDGAGNLALTGKVAGDANAGLYIESGSNDPTNLDRVDYVKKDGYSEALKVEVNNGSAVGVTLNIGALFGGPGAGGFDDEAAYIRFYNEAGDIVYEREVAGFRDSGEFTLIVPEAFSSFEIYGVDNGASPDNSDFTITSLELLTADNITTYVGSASAKGADGPHSFEIVTKEGGFEIDKSVPASKDVLNYIDGNGNKLSIDTDTGAWTLVKANGYDGKDVSFDIKATDADGDSDVVTQEVEAAVKPVVITGTEDSNIGFNGAHVDDVRINENPDLNDATPDLSGKIIMSDGATVDKFTVKYNDKEYTLEAGKGQDIAGLGFMTIEADGEYTIDLDNNQIKNVTYGGIEVAIHGSKDFVELNANNGEYNLVEYDYSAVAETWAAYEDKSVLPHNNKVELISGTGNNDTFEITLDADTKHLFDNVEQANTIHGFRALSVNEEVVLDAGKGNDFLDLDLDSHAEAHGMLASSQGLNEVKMGDGNDEVRMNIESTGKYATAHATGMHVRSGATGDKTTNLIDTSTGDDKVTINVTSARGDGDAMYARNNVAGAAGKESHVQNEINTGAGDDTVVLNASDNAMKAYAGGGTAALATPTRATNLIDTGDGDDSISVSGGAYAMHASSSSVRGNTAENIIRTGMGDDTITISGSMTAEEHGQNLIETGAGNDEVSVTATWALDSNDGGTNTINTGAGNDTIRLDGHLDGANINGGADEDTLFLDNTFTNDNYVFEGSNSSLTLSGTNSKIHNVETFEFGDDAQNIDFSKVSGGVTVKAGAGNDTIHGGTGDDILYGDDGDDVLFGGLGADKLYGGDGKDLIMLNDADFKGLVLEDFLIDGGDDMDVLLTNASNLDAMWQAVKDGKVTGVEVMVFGGVSGSSADEVLQNAGVTFNDDGKGNQTFDSTNGNWQKGDAKDGYTAYTSNESGTEVTILIQNNLL